MFKKPKRNFRQRLVKFESDDENDDMDTEETAPQIEIKRESPKPVKEKKKKEKSKSVLSFDHDEGKKRCAHVMSHEVYIIISCNHYI